METESDYQWHSIEVDGEYHTVPNQDTIIHEVNDTCICGPEVNPIECDDGSIAYHYVHDSIDGREHNEEDHDKESCLICSEE
jgi:hypothetical protein